MYDQENAAPNESGDHPEVKRLIERHQPVFSGQAGEYFGIWFVNLLLSIVTLGIYSAWAKVRTERYFYGNTALAGSSFEYLADPIAILKGRLVAYAVVIALGLSAQFSPVLYALLLLGVFALMPVIIVMSLRFRARNSAWRGLTFRFDRAGGEAYGPFMGWPLLSGITGSLLYPLMKMRQHEFVAGGHWFGRERFVFRGDLSKYFMPYLVAAGIGVGLMVAFFILLAVSMVGAKGEQPAPGLAMGMIVAVVVLYAGFFVVSIFLRVRYANMIWNNASLGGHRFESSLRVRDMMWLYASNLAAIVCTVGLAVPWAMIRLARYRASRFALTATGSLDAFVGETRGQHGAAGAELVEALDVGVDFGF